MLIETTSPQANTPTPDPQSPFINNLLLCNILAGGGIDNEDSLIFTAEYDTTITYLTITNITANFDNQNGINIRLFVYLRYPSVTIDQTPTEPTNKGYFCYNKLIKPNEDYTFQSLKIKKGYSLYIWTSKYDERFSYIIQGEQYLET